MFIHCSDFLPSPRATTYRAANIPWQEPGLAGHLENGRSPEDTENLLSPRLFTEGAQRSYLRTAHKVIGEIPAEPEAAPRTSDIRRERPLCAALGRKALEWFRNYSVYNAEYDAQVG